MRRDAASLVDPGNRALRFEIEVLLAAHPQFALEIQRTGFDRRCVAPSQPQRSGMKTPRKDRVLDGQDGRQRLVFHRHAAGATLRRIERFTEHPGDGLAVVRHLGWEERFIVPVGSRIAFARNVSAGENRGDAWFRQGGGNIQTSDQGMRVRREHRPGMQRTRKTQQQIVRVESIARHVPARALMGDRLSGNASSDLQAAASRRSQRNLATRLLATAKRYSAEPR